MNGVEDKVTKNVIATDIPVFLRASILVIKENYSVVVQLQKIFIECILLICSVVVQLEYTLLWANTHYQMHH